MTSSLNSVFDQLDPDYNYYDSLPASTNLQDSEYITIPQYNDADFTNNFTIMTYNIRSYNRNIDTFLLLFENYSKSPDIIVLTETWFEISSTRNLDGYVAHHTVREGSRSGGISIYLKNHVTCHLSVDLSYANNCIEICTVFITINNSQMTVLGIYRPHSDTIANFTAELDGILNRPCIKGKTTIILGDLNINLLSNEGSTECFINNMQSHHFLPLITKPTRFDPSNNSRPSVLDHIWYNKFNYKKCNLILSDFTDHLPICITFPLTTVKTINDKIKISFRVHDPGCKEKFHNLLSSFEWEHIKSEDADLYASSISETINELYTKSFPLKTKYISHQHRNNPWMNSRLRELIDAKSVYFTLYREGIISKQENNTFKNKITKIIDKSKTAYYKDQFYKSRNDLNKTWKNIKNLAFSPAQNCNITKLKIGNVEFTETHDICEALNEYFCSIGSEIEDAIPTTNFDPLSPIVRNSSSMFLSPVGDAECADVIKSLKNTKQDPNTLPVKILKENIETLSPVICDLINTCFSSGAFPKVFKKATVIAIFKKGEKTNPSNFRPISLLPMLSKILEKCFHVRLTDFLAKNHLLTVCQFGFQKGLSTEQAINAFCELIYDALNNNQHTVNIFIDLQKAYDTINREILIRKLDAYGIRGVPLQFIQSFLTERSQRVKVDNCTSSFKLVPTGLPTGSVLSCTLFLLYVNDVPQILQHMSPILYADDTTLHCRGSSMQAVAQACNEDLNIFSDWTKANRLSISSQKTHTFILTNRNFDPPQITLDNSLITSVPSIKFLGVTLDPKMKFNEHIKEICTKVARSSGVLYNLQKYLDTHTLITLYYSLVYPYLQYCILAWGGASQIHLNKLEILQKRCIRIITGSSYFSHTTPLFKQHNILKLKDIYNLKIAEYAYKNQHSLQSQHNRTHTHNTRFRSNLLPHFARLTTTQNSLHFKTPTLWNKVPEFIKNSSNKNRFKIAYKKYLIDQY